MMKRKGQSGEQVWVRQELVAQEMDRGQEYSHPGGLIVQPPTDRARRGVEATQFVP